MYVCVSMCKVYAQSTGIYRSQRLQMTLVQYKCWELNSARMHLTVESSLQPPQFWCLRCFFVIYSGYPGTCCVHQAGLEFTEIHLSPSVSHHTILILSWRLHERHCLKNKLLSQPTKKKVTCPQDILCNSGTNVMGVCNHLKQTTNWI